METITPKLIRWYQKHHRYLPWRQTCDPYRIWLSEIILQQTRVDQGLPYYKQFVSRFPTVTALAAASEDEVLRTWQGLGYYSRARNLLQAARQVVNKHGGVFPESYDKLRELPGVGSYTAAAIAAIAFDEPQAVVDGNVYRVLTRFYGVSEPVDTTAGKRIIEQKATALLDCSRPGLSNQALMEFGALHCTARQPNCTTCPLKASCYAFKHNRMYDFPVKKRRQNHRPRYFHYLVIRPRKHYWIRQRTGKDVWKHLYEFPVIEDKRLLSQEELLQTAAWCNLFDTQTTDIREHARTYRQTLTHQKITARFWWVNPGVSWKPPNTQGFREVSEKEFKNYTFPRLILDFLEEKILPLQLS